MQIEELVSAQRAFFNTGATKDAAFRRRALAALRQAVTAREADICAALKEDLHKSPFESYMCETGLVLSELTYMEKHLNRLMRARRAKTPLAQFPVRGQNRHAVHTAFFSKTPHAVHFIIFRIHACGMIARRRGAVRRGRCRAHAGRIL